MVGIVVPIQNQGEMPGAPHHTDKQRSPEKLLSSQFLDKKAAPPDFLTKSCHGIKRGSSQQTDEKRNTNIAP